MSTVASSAHSNQQPSPTPKKKSAKEERVNSALRAALFLHEDSHGRWEKLIANGAHDNEIWHALLKEFDGGGASQTDDGIQFAYLGGGNGVEPPKFWIDVPSHITYDRPTLKGAKLVHRVRELLQIPLMRPTVIPGVDDKVETDAANGDGVPERSALATSGEAAGGSDSAAEGHEFKPTTARDGRCADCNKPRATKEHRAFAAAQRAREKAGKPKREASFWRAQAAGMTGGIAKKLRPYDTPGRKTLRKIEEYEARIKDGLQDQQWQGTLINIADLVDEGQLPPVLFGLTNAYQVRQLMGSGRFDYAPSNMGPTIKTVEDLKAAHKALKPYVPELLDDPNLDPRDGTQWAEALNVKGSDAGSQEADGDGSSIAEADEASSFQGPTSEIIRQRRIAERNGQVNEHGVYIEGVEDVPLTLPKKGGNSITLRVVQDCIDSKWRNGNSYSVGTSAGGHSPMLDNGFFQSWPFNTREEALAAAAYEVAHHAKDFPDILKRLEAFIEGLGVSVWHEYFEQTPGEGCFLKCGKPEDDPIHRAPVADEALIDLLGLISIAVDLPTVQSWTPEQRAQAESYAAAVHLKASDNDDVVIPERPDFLPEEQSFREYFDQTIEPSGLLHKTPAIEDAPASPVTFTKEIEVELADGDYRRLARDAAFKNLQIEELQAEKDRTVAEYKKKIGGLEEERDEIMRTIRRGHALLDLEVYERRDYDRKVVETVRADNHAVVASRAMNTRELQQPLPSL